MLPAQIALPYYGGKSSHLDFIYEHLPPGDHFVDVFGGGGSVIFNLLPGSYPVNRTYNDFDSRLVNFYRVLRIDPDTLLDWAALTPSSREEFEEAKEPADDPLEDARRFWVRLSQSRSNQSSDSAGWSYSFDGQAKGGGLSERRAWVLRRMSQELLHMNIENLDFHELIRLYDRPGVVFYCDPPYMPGTRTAQGNYKYELTVEDHECLSKWLNAARAKVLLSGYDSPEYSEWYKDWRRIEGEEKVISASSNAGKTGSGMSSRREILWLKE